ncbi:MAG: glucosyltransferase domain-containing protein [bacterium]
MKVFPKLIAAVLLTALFAILFQFAKGTYCYPVTVSIEMKSDQDDICQIFYRTFKGYNEAQSIIKPYTGNTFSEITFVLPLSEVENIRFDPGSRSSTYQFKQIAIRVGDQCKRYSGKDILNHFGMVNLVHIQTQHEELLILKTTGSPDVQMNLSPTLNKDFVTVNLETKIAVFCLIFIPFLTGILLIFLRGCKIYSVVKRMLYFALSYNVPNFSTGYVKEYLKINRAIIIFSILLAFLSFGYELFNFTLSIDEEIESFQSASQSYVYIVVGRWGLYFLNQLIIPHGIMPYLPTLIALFGIVGTSVLFVSTLKDGLTAKLIFSVIFITHPIHSYYLAFNTSGLYYSIGMMLIALSYLSFITAVETRTSGFKYYFLSIILLGLALSLYQALLAFFLVLIVFYLFNSVFQSAVLNLRLIVIIISGLFAVTILSFLFYKIGDNATRYFVLEPRHLNQKAYLDNFIGWGNMSLNQIFKNMTQATKEYLTGTGGIGSEVGISLKMVMITMSVIVYFIFTKGSGKIKQLLSVLLLVFLILSPFAVMYINGTVLPARALMSLPLMIAILWLFTFRHAGNILRNIIVVAVFAIFINNTFINTRMFYATYVSWQADRDMANRIIERIYSLDPPVVNGRIKVVFVGNYQHPSNELFYRSDVHGASFFMWDNGNPGRINALFRTIGINELCIVPLNKMAHVANAISLMPSWPSVGSVSLFEDIVVVKFSNPDR